MYSCENEKAKSIERAIYSFIIPSRLKFDT